MTAIDPLNAFDTANRTDAPKSAREPTDQFGKDTFLKLLVAQLRYQNPLSPTDPTAFLSQTAQFTMVEKLQSLEDMAKNQTGTNEVLAASSMIGRSVTFSIGSADTPEPSATTKVTLGGTLPSNASTGTKHSSNLDVYTQDGKKIPLRMQFVKLPTGRDWELRVFDGERQFFGPQTLTFGAEGELTSGALTIPGRALDTITNTTGRWAASGIALDFGAVGDNSRLHLATGGATVGLREQNGTDGRVLTGIVTGVRFDVSGPVLKVGDREIPMSSVTEVHVPTS